MENKTRTLDLLNGIKYNSVFLDKELGYMQVVHIKAPDKFLCKMYKNDTFRIFNSSELKKFERMK
jgi:hypothetical protein